MSDIYSGVTKDTPSKVLFGMGVYFQGAKYDEKVAPTLEEIKSGLIGATKDGGSVTITPELLDLGLDGVTVAMREMYEKVGEKAVMETSFAELTAENIAKSVIGKIGETTDKEYDVITSDSLKAGHFFDGFGYYGHLLDGRPVIILFKQALCTSGLPVEGKNKTNSAFKGTFECMSDIEYSPIKLPYAIFVHKSEGWEAVDPDEVAAQ